MSAESANISSAASPSVAEALFQCVAETTVTTMLAQNYHWNVTGMAFGPLHALFQEIYEDHFKAQDDLAERIRAIGLKVDGRLSAMVDVSKVVEEPAAHEKDASEMILSLVAAQRILAASLAGASDVASENCDKLTEDLCVERGRVHEKYAWLLQSHIDES